MQSLPFELDCNHIKFHQNQQTNFYAHISGMLTVLLGGRWVVGRGPKLFFKTLVPQVNNINRKRTFLMDRSNSVDDRYLDGDGSTIKNFNKRRNHLPFNSCLKQV